MRALEAERDELLSSTVPREEYWAEVARKGEALKELRAIPGVDPALTQRAAHGESTIEMLMPRIEQANGLNAQIEEQVGVLRGSVGELGEQIQVLEDFLGDHADSAGKPLEAKAEDQPGDDAPAEGESKE